MNSIKASSTTPQRDSLYYLDTVTFLVENVLFKVPRRYFQTHSSVFSDIFSLPLGDKSAEGSSDDNPFKLESISKVDFQRLLKVIYPENPLLPITLTREEWISILKLSTLWKLDAMKKKALDELLKIGMSAVDKVVLGTSYRVGKWLLDGYIELVQREATISDADAAAIGSYTAIRLYQMREGRLKEDSHGRGNDKFGCNIKSRVCAIFSKELNKAGWKESNQYESTRNLAAAPWAIPRVHGVSIKDRPVVEKESLQRQDTKSRAEPLTRSNFGSNMFSMLTPEIAADTAPAKAGQPPSRKMSVDLGQSRVAEAPQWKRLF